MNKIDLIIDALQNCSAFQPKNYYEIDKALAAARELKIKLNKQEFYPDWDMLQPYHERIKELEQQLAKREQGEMMQIKDGHLSYLKKPWVGLTDVDIHVLKMNYDKLKVVHTDCAEDLTVIGQDVNVNGLINAIETKLKELNL
jgi:hypothetical protein